MCGQLSDPYSILPFDGKKRHNRKKLRTEFNHSKSMICLSGRWVSDGNEEKVAGASPAAESLAAISGSDEK